MLRFLADENFHNQIDSMKALLNQCWASCLILLTACSSTAGFERADQMKRYLTERIPTGTKVEVAERVLLSEGFDVSLKTKDEFIEEGEVRENLDYLRGERTDGFLFIRRWQVAAVLKDRKVTKILVSIDTAAP